MIEQGERIMESNISKLESDKARYGRGGGYLDFNYFIERHKKQTIR